MKSQSYPLDLQSRGFISGLTHLSSTSQPLCHYFGGIPYALPPVGPYRWQKPRALPSCYRYGTRANPGQYTGNVSLCPQPPISGEVIDDAEWDEDCLQCNVWIPVGEVPKEGWPVLFWIHGGFLQWGTCQDSNPIALLSETNFKAIIVTPAYRLNLFGFLASSSFSSSSPVPNLGFWDQRLALEWTWQNISLFSGNASNLTIGGYSAGAYSVFHQLAYDLGVPDRKSIVKRALMLSNGPGMQPKSLEDAQLQYNELLAAMGISKDLSTDEKMAKLRGLSTKALVQASMKMMHHQFRPVTDNSFVRPNLLHELESGSLARCMKRRNIKLVIGECQDEHFVYAAWKPPTNNLAGLFERLQADYPLPACEALVKHYYPGGRLPDGVKDWREAFGRLYADIQIHHLERGMINSLVKHSAGHLVYRYRMEWRAQCCDEKVPRSWGVTHATDLKIWFWGDGSDLSRKEKVIVKKAFNDNLAKFVKNGEMDWGTTHPLQIRTLKANGSVEIEDDGRMEEGLRVWEVLKRAGVMGMSMKDSKL